MAASSTFFSLAGGVHINTRSLHSNKLKKLGGYPSQLEMLQSSKQSNRLQRFPIHAEYGSRGGGGDFLAGFLLGGAVFGTLAYVFAPQIRRSLLNEDESGFQRARRPIYYDNGLENVPLIYELIWRWNVSKQCFILKGKAVPFFVEEVALISGPPNKGDVISWQSLSPTTVASLEIKTDMLDLNKQTPPNTMLKTFIMYLCSNLLFQLNNFKTPWLLNRIAINVEEFLSINWAGSIRKFLVGKFNKASLKISNKKLAGYINDFVPLLIIWFLDTYSDKRPCFLR